MVQGSSTTHVRRVSAHGISSTAAQGANSTAARSSMQPARSSAYARGAAELQPSTRQVASTPAGQGANTAASRTVGAAQTGGVSGQGSMMLHHLQSQLAMLQQQQSDQSWSQSAPSSMREGQRLGPAGPAWVGPRMALQGAVQGGGGRTQERSAGQFIEMAHEPAGGRSMVRARMQTCMDETHHVWM